MESRNEEFTEKDTPMTALLRAAMAARIAVSTLPPTASAGEPLVIPVGADAYLQGEPRPNLCSATAPCSPFRPASASRILLPAFLPADLPQQSPASNVCDTQPHFRPGMTLAELEREAIQQCLIQTGGNRQQTAERLGISTRTLFRRIRAYRLEDPPGPAAPGSDENAPAH